MKTLVRSAFGIVALLISAAPAMAHILPGEPKSFSNGFAHPLHGWDHMLAMFAVGLWAAQRGGRALWMVPAAFVSLMTFGGFLGIARVHIPAVETGIALSVLLFGLLIAFSVRMPVGFSVALIGLFAIFHGHSHGTEMAANATAALYFTGFIAATILLHATGIFAGIGLQKFARAEWIRLAGGAIAASSFFLFAA